MVTIHLSVGAQSTSAAAIQPSCVFCVPQLKLVGLVGPLGSGSPGTARNRCGVAIVLLELDLAPVADAGDPELVVAPGRRHVVLLAVVVHAPVIVVLVVGVAPRCAETHEPHRIRGPVDVELDDVAVEVRDVVGREVVRNRGRRYVVRVVGDAGVEVRAPLPVLVLEPTGHVRPAAGPAARVPVLDPVAVVVRLRRRLELAIDVDPVEAAEQLVVPVERPRRVEPRRILRVLERPRGRRAHRSCSTSRCWPAGSRSCCPGCPRRTRRWSSRSADRSSRNRPACRAAPSGPRSTRRWPSSS